MVLHLNSKLLIILEFMYKPLIHIIRQIEITTENNDINKIILSINFILLLLQTLLKIQQLY